MKGDLQAKRPPPKKKKNYPAVLDLSMYPAKPKTKYNQICSMARHLYVAQCKLKCIKLHMDYTRCYTENDKHSRSQNDALTQV